MCRQLSYIANCLMWVLLCPCSFVWASAVDSTSLSPSTATSASVVLVDSGFFFAADTTTSSHIFVTNYACPATFTPYMTLDFSRIDSLSPNLPLATTIAVAFGACVQSLASFSNKYVVTYLTTHQYYYMYHNLFSGFSLSSNAGAYSPTTPLPNFMEFIPSDYDLVNYQSPRYIHWHLYCYPPSITPPRNQTTTGNNAIAGDCSVGTNPYW